jgi:hypothetical protein
MALEWSSLVEPLLRTVIGRCRDRLMPREPDALAAFSTHL